MAPIIGCGKLEKNIFFPIIAGISTFICRIILSYTIFKDNNNDYYYFLICLISSFSMCLSIIPLIILKIKHPNIYEEYNYLEENSKMIKDYKSDRKKGFVLIIITSILDFIETLLKAKTSFSNFTNNWAVDILIISFLSKYFLKLEIHRHHILCIIIIIISGISFNIFDYYTKLNEIDLETIFISFFREIIYCLKICINRYSMDNNHISPDELCFYEGLFEFIIFIFIFIIFFLHKTSTAFFKIVNDSKEIILISLYIIFNFFYNLLINFTKKYYHPYYVINIIIIQEIGINLLNDDENKNDFEIKIIKGLIAFIFIFTFLIFNEIIEINFLGLSKNIKKNIGNRGDRETVDINESLHTIKYEEEEEEEEEEDNIGSNKNSKGQAMNEIK